ncbi:MAG TPA: aldo/keto reductase [Candidatus Nanoarchaeia archaeon]|nr:aldo/keto reductase [Candidatus Nanoarchaeia archaeon]
MEYKTIAGIKLPAIGIGTWGMGKAKVGERPESSNDEGCIAAIREAIKLGMWHIDTAEMYSSGHAEQIVAKAIKGIPREQVFITTKVLPSNLTREYLLAAARSSLQRLQISYADLYLIHWVKSTGQIQEAMEAMDELVESGKVKHIGVSNFSTAQLKLAQSHTDNKIITNQVEYSLLDRSCEKELLPYCQENDIILTAYSPLAQGKLLKNKTLATIAAKHNKTVAQVALNWLVSHENVITIPKAATLEHVRENAGAVGWKLDKEDMELLNLNFL